MRIVVDTNVLISGLFWGGTPAEIIHAWAEGKLKVVCSAEIIDEYNRIARRLNPGLDISQIDRFLSFLIGRSEIVQPNHWFKIILEDPGDDNFIDCAFHAQASMILSGDKHLLKLGKFGPIRILSPIQFRIRHPHIFKKY
jgi:putative PIN family toxin of toxin-antitoxin system